MLEKKLRERATAPFSPDVDGGIENAIMTAPNFFSAPNSKETRKLTEQVKSGGGGVYLSLYVIYSRTIHAKRM